MTSLRDKVILITGSGDGDGIGAATALHIVPFHPRVVITGRNKERLNAVGEKLRAAGIPRDRLLLVICDVTVDADLEKLVQETIQKFGRLDVLINNAAVVTYSGTRDVRMEEYDHVIRTNLRSPFLLTKLCLPHLIATKGCVVNVSSISGQRAYLQEVAYGISKAGLDHFTGILARELASHGVRVNSVNPGVILTNIQQKGGMSAERYRKYLEKQKFTHPLGYVGKPVDVAKAITFLAADDSSFITGQILFVDGGRHKSAL